MSANSTNLLSQDEVLAKILCPFCSAPWTSDMIEGYHSAGGCETCNYGSETTITITCTSCKREIYEKHI